MYQYHSRLVDRFEREVVSLAILGDESGSWLPMEYKRERLGCLELLRFPIAKLHDFRARRPELASSSNPFAIVVDAHLAAQDTHNDGAQRRAVKIGLLRRLYKRGYGREDILEIFRLVDWLLALPADQEQQFRQDVAKIEEERQMAYVTSIERMGREEGLTAGRAEGLTAGREALRRVVEMRFGPVPASLERRISAIGDLAALNALLVKAAVASSLEDIEQD